MRRTCNGYSKDYYDITYTINPQEYQPLTTYMFLYKENDPDPWWFMANTQNGSGKTTISKGFPFDINMKYEAEAVLNRGTDVEIKSGVEESTLFGKKIKRTEIPIAQIRVLNDDDEVINPSEGDDIKFSDGSKAKKRYKIELKSKVLTESCESLTGKIRVMDKNGVTIKPPSTEYYLSEYPLNFKLSEGKCIVKIADATDGLIKGKFILSNLLKVALMDSGVNLSDVAVLYGGIGNIIEIDINSAKKEIPIEPLGIIVIGIDGLRQDVLYESGEASYSDPQGCGGSCNVPIDATNLPGLYQILSNSGTVKLKNVTAIFPSITFASWASIFTGMMPGTTLDKDGKNIGGTGIMGNEFFARDRITYDANTKTYKWNPSTPPAMSRNPAGMVTISEGAFTRNHWEHLALIPPSGQWRDSPQNSLLKATTVYEMLNLNADFKKYHQSLGSKSSVVVFQHYSKGADEWVTAGWGNILSLLGGVAYAMDETPGDNAENWLKDNLLSGIWPLKKRNGIPFPGIFVVYFAGLDHEAHDAGMGGYTKFFRETTDDEIEDIVKWLKDYDEFDNKIFIITADHGHTAMPTNLTYERTTEW